MCETESSSLRLSFWVTVENISYFARRRRMRGANIISVAKCPDGISRDPLGSCPRESVFPPGRRTRSRNRRARPQGAANFREILFYVFRRAEGRGRRGGLR